MKSVGKGKKIPETYFGELKKPAEAHENYKPVVKT
jgi:hypothetical protein